MRDHNRGDVLLVDDEANTLKVMSALLAESSYRVTTARNVETAIRRIQSGPVDAVVSDVMMPGQGGMELGSFIEQNFPEIPVIFMTAYATVDAAVQAMSRGAYHYMAKPPDFNSLRRVLARAVEDRQLKKRGTGWADPSRPEEGARCVGNHPAIRDVLRMVQAVKDSDSSVLLCGETGTGKELIAKQLHFQGRRRGQPFVALNCAALPSELVESELFGCEKGAFTGALTRRVGRVEQASGGTLFLDEIGELDLAVQAKLLRVLQEKEIERLGGGKRIGVDFRLVASTNRQLSDEVNSGRFREDLFYRINVVEMRIPPLRHRKEDIPLLVTEFTREFCQREGKSLSIAKELMDFLSDYSWPGNIRQLRNVVERAVVLTQNRKMTLKDIPQEFLAEHPSVPTAALPTMRELETSAVHRALEQCGGNKSKAARMLGISRKLLYKRLNDAMAAGLPNGF